MNERQSNVAQYCDGIRTSKEIALLAGDNHKYVQEVMLKFDLPRRSRGSATGSLNGSFLHGRRIDRDGYVLVSASAEHPYARNRPNRPGKLIYEHRLMMEEKIGRYLLPGETVDHIDGLRLHNELSNLRLFQSNAEHLASTITMQVPAWSEEGRKKQFLSVSQRKESEQIHTYSLMKKNGDARLRQILLAALSLGKDSPFLLGSHHHLEKAGISDFSRSSLELSLAEIDRKYALIRSL